MQGRAGVGHEISVLDHEEVAARVRWNNFEGERTEAEGVEMPGAVFASGDGVKGGG